MKKTKHIKFEYYLVWIMFIFALGASSAFADRQMDVPVFGQGQQGQSWANDQLGTCSLKMKGWGCAVTSAAMVLKYYGLSTDPGELNSWLKGQNGYAWDSLGNGRCNIYWSVAATRKESITWTGRYDYRNVPADLSKIKTELNNGYPVIAEMCPNYVPFANSYHFVVITGYSGSTYYISDPWYGDTSSINARYGDPARSICGIRLFHGTATSASSSATNLDSGQSVSDYVSKGSWKNYKIQASSSHDEVKVELTNLSDDLDLYVRRGSQPTKTKYDCRPYYSRDSSETCTLDNSGSNTWYIAVHGYNAGTFKVEATLSGGSDSDSGIITTLSSGQRVSGYVSKGSWKNYKIQASSSDSELKVDLTNLSDDVDLYVRKGSLPDTIRYDCRPYFSRTSSETCELDNSGNNTWYIGLRGFKAGSFKVKATLAQANLPGNISVSPSSGNWTDSPHWISVSCPDAEKIYCTLSGTTDGSSPDNPREPTAESHDPFDINGVDYISGSSGSFKFWGSIGQIKRLKVRFRGWNEGRYGPTSNVYSYTIDLRTYEPGRSITITNPRHGEKWRSDEEHKIKWTTSNISSSKHMMIMFSPDNGNTWHTVPDAERTRNDGSKKWYFGNDYRLCEDTSKARIRMICTEYPEISAISEKFTIDHKRGYPECD